MARVLILADYYLPGFRAGGPIRSISRIADFESSAHEIFVVTRNHDLGDHEPYAVARSGRWVQLDSARVLYLGWSPLELARMIGLIRATAPDVVYLNSLFSPWFTILPLAMRPFVARRAVWLLAPRGELDPGALSIKPLKKRLARFPLKMLVQSRKILFHATTRLEAENIAIWLSQLPTKMIVASDPGVPPLPKPSETSIREESRPLRVVWLSRIVPKKDLQRFIQILSRAPFRIQASIYGPIEDGGYWQSCLMSIEGLPANIKLNYKGVLAPLESRLPFLDADVFLFPTRGENFGHVIAEALSVGCPVATTKTTPWDAVLESGGGIASNDDAKLLAYLEELHTASTATMHAIRTNCWHAYSEWHAANGYLHRSMFNEAVELIARE